MVVGGGVVGIATALRLQMTGATVKLVDRDEPGRGCSFGNAGVIATSFVLPLSSPHHILAAPRLLADPLGPLAVRIADLPSLAPWLSRFVLNAAPRRQRRTIEGLKHLNGSALASWRALLSEIGGAHHLIERGMLDVARTARAATSLSRSAERLRAEGVRVTALNAREVAELEPALSRPVSAGLLHDDVAHVDSPFGVLETLFAAFLGLGGEFVKAEVTGVVPKTDGRVDVVAEATTFTVDAAVVACGHASPALLSGLGVKAPLGVELGYHLMLPSPGEVPTRPVSFHAESFLATPMLDGLRLAGTVELARPDAAPDWRRAEQLLILARKYLPNIAGEDATRWMGVRPSFPDALPAIGTVPGASQIAYAFGHQHLGLTLAAITGDCVRQLLANSKPSFPMDPYSLDRFGPALNPTNAINSGTRNAASD